MKFINKLAIIIIFSIFFLNTTDVFAMTTGLWFDVGSIDKSASHLSLSFDSNDTPYIAFNDNETNKIWVSKYNGTTWENVGTPGFSEGIALYNSLVIDSNDVPYLAFLDIGDNTIKVMSFNGTSWENVGVPGFTGGFGSYLVLSLDNEDIPYIAFSDASAGNGGKTTVMKYNGINWEYLGSPAFSNGTITKLNFAIDKNNIPYVAFSDSSISNKVSVMKYTGSGGTGWESVGLYGLGNINAQSVNLTLDSNDVPYLAFSDLNNILSVMKYTGLGVTGWENISDPMTGRNPKMAFNSEDVLNILYLEDSDPVYKIFRNNAWEVFGNIDESQSTVYDLKIDSNNNPYIGLVYSNIIIKKSPVDPLIYSYSGIFNESIENPGAIQGVGEIMIANDTFVSVEGNLIQGTHYNISNVPQGLTPVISIYQDGEKALLTFTGSAIEHGDANDVDNLTITFLNGAFTNTAIASNVPNYSHSFGINFMDISSDFSGTSTLYASDGTGSNSTANLYILDQDTGNKISTVGALNHSINGMDFYPNTSILYGNTSNTDKIGQNEENDLPFSLFTINKDTAETTYLGTIQDENSSPIGFADIAFRSDGKLYGRSGWEKDNYYLYNIDITCPLQICLATQIGNTDIGDGGGGGLDFDKNNNLYIFTTEDDGFYKVNSNTGEILQSGQFVNGTPDGRVFTSAKFNGNDVLYATRLKYNGSPADLTLIEITDGFIASFEEENPDMNNMTALAFYNVPSEEPEEPEEPEQPEQPRRNRSSGSSASARYNFFMNSGNAEEAKKLEIQFPSLTNNPQLLINRLLKYGVTGQDVKELQIYLNSHGFKVSEIGPGSLNNETTFFGLKTKQAVIKFQKANGLVADGIVGSITRSYLK